MSKVFKLAIIGAGAAGLAAAAEASRLFGGASVILIEKQQKIGRKLLATGNGRCNISNKNMSEAHYYGDRSIISSVIGEFGVSRLRRFFSELGLLLREDSEGRLYPYSNQAVTVLDCSRNYLSKAGTAIQCDCRILRIEKNKGGFIIVTSEKQISAENIIAACGSKASPSLGADDSGSKLMNELGIKYTRLFPALSPVETKEKYPSLKGVRAKGTVNVIADDSIIRSKSGEIQFSDKGISGICIFECSRPVNEYLLFGTAYGKKVKSISIELDLMPDYNSDELCRYLRGCKSIFKGQPAELLLAGVLNKELSRVIIKKSLSAKKLCHELTEEDIQKTAFQVKHFSFTPVKADSFKTAQVCAGGIDSGYVCPDTLMSKKYKGLYICGEMLDVDGDCGGYNLHFAVASAIKAVRNIK